MAATNGIFSSFALAIAVAPVFLSHSQQKAAADAPIKLKAELVVVDAQVVNRKTGLVVNGLTKDDFAVYEDGVKQQIAYFGQDSLPLSIVLLLDVSGSVRPVIDQIRAGGLDALRQLKREDEVAIIAFGQWTVELQDFTNDRAAVINRVGFIKDMGVWIESATYIDEAVYQAAAFLRKAANPDSRRCIIVVTDDLSNQPEGRAHSQRDAALEVRESGSVVSCVRIGDYETTVRDYKQQGYALKEGAAPYVADTGGLMISASTADVSAKLANLIERLRTRYSLGYFSTNAKRDGKFRKIKVRLTGETGKLNAHAAVAAKKGYYAPQD